MVRRRTHTEQRKHAIRERESSREFKRERVQERESSRERERERERVRRRNARTGGDVYADVTNREAFEQSEHTAQTERVHNKGTITRQTRNQNITPNTLLNLNPICAAQLLNSKIESLPL
jgi:hypothetical protein